MNLNYLETFVMVARYKSFSRAAGIINLTQPAISKHIALLEAHYGTKLVNRTSRRVELTDAGNALFHFAEQIIALVKKSEEEVNSFSEEVKGHLALGASTIPGHYLLPRLVGRFKKEYPLVSISLEISNTGKVITRLREEAIQIGVVGAPVDGAEIRSIPFTHDELVLIAPKGHPLTTRSEITAGDLTGAEVLIRETGSGTRRIIEEKLTAAGVLPKQLPIAGEFGSTEAILAAVEAGLGVSFVSRWAAEKAAQAGKLELRTLKDLNLARSLYLIYLRNRSLSRPAQAFLSFVNNN